jgi:arabinogalactan oligomer/maltooligosaccharide transport system substrate-binding protein
MPGIPNGWRGPIQNVAAFRLVAVAAAITALLAGCTDDRRADPQASPTRTGGSLVIWSAPGGAAALRPFVDRFAKTRGVSVTVRDAPAGMPADFVSAAKNGQGPDIVAGPHEWIGSLVEAGVIEAVPLSSTEKGVFAGAAVRAVTYEGKTYGVPYGIENAALIRNTDLAPDPPHSIEEAVAIGGQLQRLGKVTSPLAYPVGQHGDAYYLYPLYASAGGYLFGKKSDDKPDLKDLGVGKPEGVAAFSKIASLGVKGSGALKPEVDLDTAVATFVAGETPFLVAGPGVLPRLRDSGIDYQITSIPGFNGGNGTGPLIRISAYFVSAKSTNPALARELVVNVLSKTEVSTALYGAESRLPALTAGLERARDNDPDLQPFFDTGRGGLLVPAVPEMALVWGPFGQAEVAVLTGADVQQTVQIAAKAMYRGGP